VKKKHPEHVNLERWLVSYADFITLLFAFFVVMYAMANQDKAKVKQITEAIERTFRGPSTMIDMGSGKNVNVMSNPMTDYGQILTTETGRSNARPEATPELADMAKRIEESIAYQLQNTDLKDIVKIIHDDQGVVIRFSANKLFKPGSDAVEKQFLPLLDKIGKIVAPSDRIIRVEGHTDDSPLPREGKFDTNWELSAARAIWIVRYLRARFEIPTARLSAAGFADGQPLAKNDTEEGKAMNRRVEIVVTNLKVAPKK
jgi:chemotaxis protein MotB